MSAPDLQDVLERRRLAKQLAVQRIERRQKVAAQGEQRGDVNGGRKQVVARLAAVYVVVRVDRLTRMTRAGEQLVGALGDDLVGVHVARRARPRLEDVHHEMRVEPARGDFPSRPDNRVRQELRKQSERGVGHRRRRFERAQGVDRLCRAAIRGD